METPYQYELFISYATDPDYRLARNLESFLESFHHLENPSDKPLKQLRVCRDGSDFHIASKPGQDGQTSSTIYEYLSRSEQLLVLCSRGARSSTWVEDEIAWFLEHRGPAAIRIAITEGATVEEIEKVVFPPSLIRARLDKKIGYDFRGFRGRASREWKSVRLFEDERTRLAADLNERSLDEIQPIWASEQKKRGRRRVQIAAAVAVGMAALAAFGWYERSRAVEQAEQTRRQLYVTSLNLADRAWNEGSVDLARSALESQVSKQGQADLRDFDWFHLWRRTKSEKMRLLAPLVALESLSVSSDGSLVAGGGRQWSRDQADQSSRLVYIWSLATGQLIRKLSGHTESVTAVAFSPVERRLASASNKEIIVWDMDTGAELFRRSTLSVNGLLFSPDGQLLAAREIGTILLFRKNGEILKSLYVHSTELGMPVFSPDGKKIVVGDYDGAVHLFDVGSVKQVRILGKHQGRVAAACWMPDSRLVATGGLDRQVRFWDTEGTLPQTTSLEQADGVQSLAVNREGVLAVGLGDPLDPDTGRSIALWNLRSNTPIVVLRGMQRRIEQLAFTPDGQNLLSATEEEALRVWDVAAAQFKTSRSNHGDPIWSLSYSPDGKHLAAAENGGHIAVHDLDKRMVLRSEKIHEWRVQSVSLDPRGRYVASTGQDYTVRVWDAALKPPGQELAKGPWGFTEVAFSPDGIHLAAAGSCQGFVLMWLVDKLQPVPHPKEHGCLVFAAWSPDSSTLATGGSETPNSKTQGSVFLWRVAESNPALTLVGHQPEPRCAAFSPDGRTLAVGDLSGDVYIWDVTTRTRRLLLSGHRGSVNGVAYSPRGRVVASVGDDKTVRIWDLATGQQRIALTDVAESLNAVRFRPDGQALAVAGSEGTISIWLAAPTESAKSIQ